jgi:hypothetical protein
MAYARLKRPCPPSPFPKIENELTRDFPDFRFPFQKGCVVRISAISSERSRKCHMTGVTAALAMCRMALAFFQSSQFTRNLSLPT